MVRLDLFTPNWDGSSWTYTTKLLHKSDSDTYVLNGKCTVQDNSAGSLSFVILPNNPAYDDIYIRRSEITLTINDVCVFCGYVSKISTDFYKQKTVQVTGVLDYLKDSILLTNEYRPLFTDNKMNLWQFLYTEQSGSPGDAGYTGKGIIRQHNDMMGDCHWKKFQIDTQTQNIISASGETSISFLDVYTSDYDKTLDFLQKKIFSGLNCHYKVIPSISNNIVYKDIIVYTSDMAIFEHSGNDIKQIMFGQNLTDCKSTFSSDKLVTGIFPIGKEVEGDFESVKDHLTIASVNSGKKYIESEDSVALYGRIYSSQKYTDFKNVSEASSLKIKANTELQNNRFLIDSLEITAVDLHYLSNNSAVTQLYDVLHIKSGVHKLDTNLICTKIDYDISDLGNSKLYFGKTNKKLSTHLRG